MNSTDKWWADCDARAAAIRKANEKPQPNAAVGDFAERAAYAITAFGWNYGDPCPICGESCHICPHSLESIYAAIIRKHAP